MSAGSLQLFSLRTKLLVFAAALVLVPGGIYGTIAVSSSRAAVAEVIGRQLVEEARNAADRLATTLRSESRRLEWFAVQDVMREIRIGDLDKRISSLLASGKSSCPACIDLFVLDDRGGVVASSNPARIGAKEPPGGDAAAGVTIEGPLAADGAASSMLRLALPIPDPDRPRSRLGRLVALLDWRRTSEVLVQARANLASVGLEPDILIVDRGGVVIGGAIRAAGRWQPGSRIALPSPDPLDPATTGQVDAEIGVLLGQQRLPDDLPPWSVVVAEPLADA
ncbi:MAG: hypothetical protein ACREQQ_14840, partial [Candidatus Binatia bacterium]